MSTTALPVDTVQDADAAFKDANSGDFPLLPKGWYEVTFVKGEVVDFAKEGANAGKKALNAQFRVVDDAPEGRGRVFFGRIPLFQRYAPNQKNPQGAVASDYFNAFLAFGQDEAAVKAGQVTIPDGGTRLAIRLDQSEWNGETRNEVRGYRAPRALDPSKSASGTPSAFANRQRSQGDFTPKTSESPWGSKQSTEQSSLQQAADASQGFQGEQGGAI